MNQLLDWQDDAEDNPRKQALSLGLLDNEDDYKDPLRFASKLGLTDSEKEYQNPLSLAGSVGYPRDDQTAQPENYLDDSFGSVTRNLPIDQPSGSIVSGGREDLYHKYSQLLEQKPESENILENYMGRRPTREQYGNSTGRKVLAGIVGLGDAFKHGGGSAYKTVSGILDDPYEKAKSDYDSEGSQVATYAKLQDSSRNRQMSSLLSQMRMDEVARANKAREDSNGILRGIQQTNAQTAQQRLGQTNDYNKQRLDLTKRGQDLRHSDRISTNNRLLESLNLRENRTGKPDKPLSPSQQLSQIKLDDLLKERDYLKNYDPQERKRQAIFQALLDQLGSDNSDASGEEE